MLAVRLVDEALEASPKQVLADSFNCKLMKEGSIRDVASALMHLKSNIRLCILCQEVKLPDDGSVAPGRVKRCVCGVKAQCLVSRGWVSFCLGV